MNIDPHLIHHVLRHIHQHLRCPQCSRRVPVDINSIKGLTPDHVLLQLHCGKCNAHLMLQASLQELEKNSPDDQMKNASSLIKKPTNSVSEDVISDLKTDLQKAEGSFQALFGEIKEMGEEN